MLYHRGCCHNDAKTFDDYLSPMQRAINNIADGEGMKKGGKKPKMPKLCSGLFSRDVILKQYNNAMREEAKFGMSPALSICITQLLIHSFTSLIGL
jgi:hypothetical protein